MIFTEVVLRIFMIDHSKTFVMHINVYIYSIAKKKKKKKKDELAMSVLLHDFFSLFK